MLIVLAAGDVFQQKFQADIESRDQTLSSLINEGRALIDDGCHDGADDDAADLQRNLSALETRWRDVVQQASQQRCVIDTRLQLWTDYRRLLEQLSHRLDEVTESVCQHPVTLCDTTEATRLLELYHVSRVVIF